MPALFLLYVLAEVTALAVAAHFLGVGATILLVLGGTFLGLALVRSQWRRVLEGFRRAADGAIAPAGPLADGALVALGSALLIVPGLVTTVLGLLLVLPPTRALVRVPVLAFAARRVATATAHRRPGVIDGEVVDSRYEPVPLPLAIESRPHTSTS